MIFPRIPFFSCTPYSLITAQTGGIALGLSLAGAVFVNLAVGGLTAILPGVSRSELQLAVSGTSGDYFLSLPQEQQTQAVDAIVDSLAKVFILVYVGAAVTLILSLLFTVKTLSLPNDLTKNGINFPLQ